MGLAFRPDRGSELTMGSSTSQEPVELAKGNPTSRGEGMTGWREFLDERYRSFQELVYLPALWDGRVSVFGAGGVGSPVCESLERAGVGRLTVCDRDKVSIANIARSAYSVCDLGRPKEEAAAELAAALNPFGTVAPAHVDLLRAPEEVIVGIGENHDVAVIAADDVRVHRRLNRLLHPVLPCVFPYVTFEGDGGEIVRTTPGQRGCVECLTNIEEREAAGVAGDFQALGVDFRRVAEEATRVVLGLLLQNQEGGELFSDYVDPRVRLLLVFTRRRRELAETLPAEVVSGTARVDTSGVRRNCRVCGTRRRR